MQGQVDLVRDSHAEVLARRAFVRYLHGQIALLVPSDHGERCGDGGGKEEQEESIFESIADQNSSDCKCRYRLRDGFRIHLYVSLALCEKDTGTFICHEQTRRKPEDSGSTTGWQPKLSLFVNQAGH